MRRGAASPQILALLVVMLCVACGRRHSLLPASGGRPYEVLLVADDSMAADVVDSVLSADVAGLPQSEPCFDVFRTTTGGLNATTRLSRAIVVVERGGAMRLEYEKDAYAMPQMLVRLTTDGAEELRHKHRQWGLQLRQLLERAEANRTIATLRENPHRQAMTLVEQRLRCTLTLPKELAASKKAEDFLWFSNNTPQAMRNICVYSLPGRVDGVSRFALLRDSVMKRNIPGEHPGMYVKTVTPSLMAEHQREKDGTELVLVRGLWEMEGDMMGGPFVARLLADERRGRTIVAEAFVYAPEQNKRNIMRLTEAALYTLNIKNN